MQNKRTIWTFAILLTLACLYQLSFTFVATGVESDALEEANRRIDSTERVDGALDQFAHDSLKHVYESEYLLDISHKEVYPLLGHSYKYCKRQEINLGLDLQGGMNVILEVSLVDLIKVLSGDTKDETFQKALALAVEKQKSSQANLVTLFGQEWEKIAPGNKLAAIFHTLENKQLFPRDATNEQVIEIIQEEANGAVNRTKQVIEKRVDNLGVVQPKVQILAGSGRILVELPGVKNKERIRKLLQGTAKLEFIETYDFTEIYSGLELASEILQKKFGDKEEEEGAEVDENGDTETVDKGLAGLFGDDAKEDSTTIAEPDEESNLLNDLEGDPVAKPDTTDTTAKELTLEEMLAAGDTAAAKRDTAPNASNVLFEIMYPNIQQNTDGQFFLGEGPLVGYSNLSDTAKVNKYLALPEVLAVFPPRIKFVWEAKTSINEDSGVEFLRLYAMKPGKDGNAQLEGDVIVNASVQTDPLGNPEVQMIMNADGAKSWRAITKANIGRSVAVVLDNLVYTAPTIQGEIPGGVSVISGRFSAEEADDLANVLKAGKLPAPARIIEESVVGPSLGQEAISSGFSSFIIALAIILLYMIFYYNRAGVVANIALVVNLFFVIGVLASLGATLTLPGIAGIVLTIGMSVDANVLIFERIREEMAEGKGIRLAISDGYKNARYAIIDANLTTLFTGFILLIFGHGPIKGFATTLIIGILTSLFCAIFITRLIFEWQMKRNKKITFDTRITKGAFRNINIAWVPRRKMYYAISGIVIAVGIFSLATRGLDQGVDFTGGRSYIVRFEESVDVEEVGNVLENAFISEEGLKQRPEVKTIGASTQLQITTKHMINQQGSDTERQVEEKLFAGLKPFLSEGTTLEQFNERNLMSQHGVGPTIADDIKVSAIWSTVFALLVIFFYILLRFRKWQFSIGALIAMSHDVIVVLSVFSIFYGMMPFSMEIDQAFIAAILTVVGYSINDTVVVFDRIREHVGRYKKKDYNEVVNGALNSTLSRTINTSVSTFFVLLMIFLFGGEVIQGFVFALMIGVVVGTYSSLCIATPIIIDFASKKTLKSKQ